MPKVDMDNLPEPKNWHKGITLAHILPLREKGLSHTQISKLLGCSPSNITQRLQGYDVKDVETYGKSEATVVQAVKMKVVHSLLNDDLKKASPYQKAGMFGLFSNIYRLLTDQSTVNISMHSMLVEAACHGKPIVHKVEKAASEDAPQCAVTG